MFECTLQSTLETTFTVLNLGIGLGFMVLLHPSKHARDYVYGFYSSTLVTKPISEPGQTKEPGRNDTIQYSSCWVF